MDDLRSPTPPRLDRFLTYWYGPADREPSDPAGGDRRLPRPLREWFEVTSQWSTPLAQQNTVLDGESVWIEDGKLVFWVENQGVWTWAVDPDLDDGQVYDREPETDQPWQLTGVGLSVFLVHVAVFEAIFTARHGGSSARVRPEHLSEVLAPLAPIPGTAWRWPSPGHDLYSGDGLLAMAGPNDGPGETPETAEYREVFIAGRDRSALQYLAGIDGIEWDWSSWHDGAQAAWSSEPVERPSEGQQPPTWA